MEFFNPSNLVMIFFFKNEIFLKTISETLTCVFVEKSIDYLCSRDGNIPEKRVKRTKKLETSLYNLGRIVAIAKSIGKNVVPVCSCL